MVQARQVESRLQRFEQRRNDYKAAHSAR
jgi:hypothetical protein